MNIVFLTLERIGSITERSIYKELLRCFIQHNHKVYVVSPEERRYGKKTSYTKFDGGGLLRVRILNNQKTNIVEKGLSTLLIESQFRKAIEDYLADISFDLILYSTPPITFTNVVRSLKKKNSRAISYLLLKDIFPQNAVDIGMFGEKSIFNCYFRKKEIALYNISDYIGCMSPANVDYLINKNSYIDPARVEIAPNSISLNNVCLELSQNEKDKIYIRKKYNIPLNRTVFIYGGNLGKPQGIPFLIDCLTANQSREDCFFVIVGSGTELSSIEKWYGEAKPQSAIIMKGLPKEEYDILVRSCDVGMIFLDHRFTIPNYPSRLLSYLENRIPVLCATDPNTDIGRIAEENGYGYWCESNSVDAFTTILNRMLKSDRKTMGEKGYMFLKENYLVENTYNVIMKHV